MSNLDRVFNFPVQGAQKKGLLERINCKLNIKIVATLLNVESLTAEVAA